MATAAAISVSNAGSGALTRDDYPDILDTAFEEIKWQTWADAKGRNQGLKHFTVRTTDRSTVKLSSLGSFTTMRESSDEDRYPEDKPAEGFDVSITPLTYRKGTKITKRLRETDQFDLIRSLQSRLAVAPWRTIEYLTADAFNSGFTSAARWLCADGMYLFDSARPLEDPMAATNTWSNLETASALSNTTFETMRQNFRATVNDRGDLAPIKMEKVIVPPELQKEIYEITESSLRSDTALNAINFQKSHGYEISVWDYLTDNNAWFGCGPMTEADHQLYLYWGVKPETRSVQLESRDVMLFTVRMAVETGCLRPQNLRGNAGA